MLTRLGTPQLGAPKQARPQDPHRRETRLEPDQSIGRKCPFLQRTACMQVSSPMTNARRNVNTMTSYFSKYISRIYMGYCHTSRTRQYCSTQPPARWQAAFVDLETLSEIVVTQTRTWNSIPVGRPCHRQVSEANTPQYHKVNTLQTHVASNLSQKFLKEPIL